MQASASEQNANMRSSYGSISTNCSKDDTGDSNWQKNQILAGPCGINTIDVPKSWSHEDLEKCTIITSNGSYDSEDDLSFQTNLLWKMLGFEKNPLCSKNNVSTADLRLSMLSNFSTAYNVVSISLALDLMSPQYDLISETDRSLCSVSLLAGMVLGQLGGGALGDSLGRHVAMDIIMFLQIFASIASAFSFDYQGMHLQWIFGNARFSTFIVLAVWRFILGVGCGGVYPLSATISAESSQSKGSRGKLVALAFSMQGLGYLTVPVVAYILICIFGSDSDMTWRLLLGLGSIPGIILMVDQISKRIIHAEIVQENSESCCNAQDYPPINNENSAMCCNTYLKNDQDVQKQHSTTPIFDAIIMEENLTRKMVGTAGCWFLFDVLFYGNTLFQPVVLSAAFGNSETVLVTARDTFIIASLSVPGYFVSIASTGGKRSPKYIQMQGFLVMAILYFVIGFWFYELKQKKMLLLILYGLTFFFSNYGPNATTFMLPSLTFSKSCRSTLNGICAACGKAGALMGATLFAPTAINFGDDVVMIICAVISMLSFILTGIFVSSDVGVSEDENIKNGDEDFTQDGKNGSYGSTVETMITLESGSRTL